MRIILWICGIYLLLLLIILLLCLLKVLINKVRGKSDSTISINSFPAIPSESTTVVYEPVEDKPSEEPMDCNTNCDPERCGMQSSSSHCPRFGY